jgi:hypothetical protein
VKGLGEDSAHWQKVDADERHMWKEGVELVRAFARNISYRQTDADELYCYGHLLRMAMHEALKRYLSAHPDRASRFGLLPPSLGIPFEVEGVLPVERIGPDGQKLQHFVVRLAQKARVDLKVGSIDEANCIPVTQDGQLDPIALQEQEMNTVIVRGGATLIFDGVEGGLLYSIRKNILNEERWQRRKKWELANRGGRDNMTGMAFSGSSPFAFLHRGRADLKTPAGGTQ